MCEFPSSYGLCLIVDGHIMREVQLWWALCIHITEKYPVSKELKR